MFYTNRGFGFFLGFMALTLITASCPQLSQAQDRALLKITDSLKTITVEDLDSLALNHGYGTILDVRTEEEFNQGHIDGASLVSYRDKGFEYEVDLLDKQKLVVVYCNTGDPESRSEKAANWLQKDGFQNVRLLNGGLLAWEDADLPVAQSEGNEEDTDATPPISLKDFQDFLDTDKPVLVDFHTLWCTNCLKMVPIVDSLKEVFKENAIVTRINVSKNKEIRKAYQINGVPDIIIFLKGKKVWEHKGFISGEELIAKVREYQQG